MTISLATAHLIGTPHQRHPELAVEAVRDEVEAIPGACWVSVEWCGTLPAGICPLIDRLEIVGPGARHREDTAQLRKAVEASVQTALRTLPRAVEKPAPVVVPEVVRAALVEIPDRIRPDLPAEVREAKRLERRAKLREIEERRRRLSP